MLITDVRYFKPEVITAILRSNKVIADHEEVSKLAQLNRGKTDQYNYFTFAVQYKDFRTQRHAPDHLQLRISYQGASKAKREIDFYERFVTVMKRRLNDSLIRIPTAYDIYYDDISDQFHMILEDVRHEFEPSADKAPPTQRHREQVIDTLSAIHGYWWEHPLLEEIETYPTEKTSREREQAYQEQFSRLKSSVGQYLDTKHMTLLEQIASGIPSQRKQRMLDGKGLTLIHNNLTPDNTLYSTRETYFINWQNWAIGTGTDDLATQIPFNWPTHLRQFQEKQLLKRYFDTMQKRGASDYTWEQFEYDYKASLANIIGSMLLEWTRDNHTRGHWRDMEAALDSFTEMDGQQIYI